MTPSLQSPKPINLLRGWPAPSLLPHAALLRAAQTCLTTSSIYIPGLQYGSDPGFKPLREQLANWLSGFYSSPDRELKLKPDYERICISGGASQNLACILQVFADPGVTTVWMVSPCYFLAKRIFEDSGLSCYDVGEGEEGVDLRMLEEEIRLCQHEGGKPLKRKTPWSKIYRHIIYCVPTFSNPSGKTMTLSARQSLVELARKHDALIITDDVYDFLQWPTSTSPTTSPASLPHALLPRLVDIDRTMFPYPSPTSFGNAVSNGSFSKIAGPGVRTGWAEGTPKFAYGLSQVGSSRSGGAPSQIAATMMAEMLRTGDLQRHIEENLKPAYKKRYETMMAAIRKELLPLGVGLGETSFTNEDATGKEDVFGGYFIWIELPKNVNAEAVTERAKEVENLVVAPGALFEVSADSDIKFENSLRLSFSWEDEEDLAEGIVRLKRATEDVMRGEFRAGSTVKRSDLREFS